ncbi:MAG: hypothetical protein B193_3880 [Solidesulfovibrio magneticus str. Maddingley MBC34]|uniref:Nucleoside 2-deoxyribosyltransferase n=1 Tax=Solidesulfovibrio magneticus str. Maddingley MBC34 TaxID=1206767 RepID=K6H4L8_9BACT|nr:MAG: hypothetical protein B193_3880 [Solidesulfovibrio magneticus str. Maddingley MBC34]
MNRNKPREWISLMGNFETEGDKLICKGGVWSKDGLEDHPMVGMFLTEDIVSDGKVQVDVEFTGLEGFSLFDIVLSYNASNRHMMLAGIGSLGPMYQISKFERTRELIASTGDGTNLKAGKIYSIEVVKEGSLVSLTVNGIKVVTATLPYVAEKSNIGISTMSRNDIVVHRFEVFSERPKAFVVMQFSDPYNQFYSEIIKDICGKFGIQVKRADENFGTGMVIADIVNDITESTFIIADISKDNPNVYYEIGYAHALNKPTIILAEKGTALPFDISPFRVLFYENTIIGRGKFEEGLRGHLESMIKS